MRKVAEDRFRSLTKHYGWYRHKYGDVRYCAVCHAAQPKSENAPDFYASLVGAWVEAKNADATGAWKCSEIYEDGARKNQREFLKKEDGWLFIDLSTGHHSRHAYLVPWTIWERFVEPELHSKNMASITYETARNNDGKIRRIGADILLKDFELAWETNTGWVIPNGHIWWTVMKRYLEDQLQKVGNQCQSQLTQTKFPNM